MTDLWCVGVVLEVPEPEGEGVDEVVGVGADQPLYALVLSSSRKLRQHAMSRLAYQGRLKTSGKWLTTNLLSTFESNQNKIQT